MLRLRVYASADYRSQTLGWSTRFKRIVDRVNRVVAPWPGVRFEIVETRNWERPSANVPLDRLLADLEAADSGRDVDWVIGLAAAVPTMPTQIHNLAMARPAGRHFVIRNLHDLAEYDVVRSAFDQMSSTEQDHLMSLRKAHKEQVVFLHEWAHTLGLIHAQSWQSLMNPSYHHGQSRFSETEARLIELGLQHRSDADFRVQLARSLDQDRDPDWDPRDREARLAELSHATGRAPSPSVPVVEPVSSAEIQSLLKEANSGHIKEAWIKIWPLLGEKPHDARLHILACDLACNHPPPFLAATRDMVCGRAATLDEDSAQALLAWADAQHRSHVDGMADKLVGQAEARLARRSTAELWKRAAALRQQLTSPTLAILDTDHLDSAEATSAMTRWAAQTRRRWLIPQGLPPEREGEYARQVQAILSSLASRLDSTAEILVHQLAETFPNMPIEPLVGCIIDTHKGTLAKAQSECEKALALQVDSIPTQLALAELAKKRGRRQQADSYLRRAQELEGP